jgi:hypothetical protein
MDKQIISKTADDIKGIINIFPTIESGRHPSVRIMGDPEGLRYLANLLNTIADFDQDINDAPEGSREHTILTPETHLGAHSCKVELCRADAKGSKELPDFFED